MFDDLDHESKRYSEILHARVEHWIKELNKISGKHFTLNAPEAPKAKSVKTAAKESE